MNKLKWVAFTRMVTIESGWWWFVFIKTVTGISVENNIYKLVFRYEE